MLLAAVLFIAAAARSAAFVAPCGGVGAVRLHAGSSISTMCDAAKQEDVHGEQKVADEEKELLADVGKAGTENLAEAAKNRGVGLTEPAKSLVKASKNLGVGPAKIIATAAVLVAVVVSNPTPVIAGVSVVAAGAIYVTETVLSSRADDADKDERRRSPEAR